MGRQVPFRATDDDLRALEVAFRDRGGCFLAYYHHAPEPSFVSSFDRRTTTDPIIWLARPEDLPAVRLKHVPAQGYWLVDQLRSPVVELSRGAADPGSSGPGRLHFNTTYYDDDGAKREFPAAFVAWASGLLGYIRRTFTRNAEGLFDGPGLRAGAASRSNEGR